MSDREIRTLIRMQAMLEAARQAGRKVRLAVVEEVVDTQDPEGVT